MNDSEELILKATKKGKKYSILISNNDKAIMTAITEIINNFCNDRKIDIWLVIEFIFRYRQAKIKRNNTLITINVNELKKQMKEEDHEESL